MVSLHRSVLPFNPACGLNKNNHCTGLNYPLTKPVVWTKTTLIKVWNENNIYQSIPTVPLKVLSQSPPTVNTQAPNWPESAGHSGSSGWGTQHPAWTLPALCQQHTNTPSTADRRLSTHKGGSNLQSRVDLINLVMRYLGRLIWSQNANYCWIHTVAIYNHLRIQSITLSLWTDLPPPLHPLQVWHKQ